jgi:dienelactone hydrolase
MMTHVETPRETLTMHLPDAGVTLTGDLTLPPDPLGVVVFAHGSGSSRLSPRNRQVAEDLVHGGLGTLLFDLLTPREEQLDRRTGELRFDIALLGRRLVAVADWLELQRSTGMLPLGCFGASTGAAAALVAAAVRPGRVRAVVSRGGRPDLAGGYLSQVRAPTLLLVGGRDANVIDLNERALLFLRADEKRLEIVPGAGHLFEEPGAMEQVSAHARRWFVKYLES